MRIDKIAIKDNFLKSDDNIQWEVFADNAEPRRGEIPFKDIKIIEK